MLRHSRASGNPERLMRRDRLDPRFRGGDEKETGGDEEQAILDYLLSPVYRALASQTDRFSVGRPHTSSTPGNVTATLRNSNPAISAVERLGRVARAA